MKAYARDPARTIASRALQPGWSSPFRPPIEIVVQVDTGPPAHRPEMSW
jgi:hypothetical protein